MAEQLVEPLRVQCAGNCETPGGGEVEIDLGSGAPAGRFRQLSPCAANRVIAREELVSSVWGENPPARRLAAASIHTSPRLRRVLEPHRVQVGGRPRR